MHRLAACLSVLALTAISMATPAGADNQDFISALDKTQTFYVTEGSALRIGYAACSALQSGESVQASYQHMDNVLGGQLGATYTGTTEKYFFAAAQYLCPDQWSRVKSARNRPPTITDPQGTRTVIMNDVYMLICNDLDANGVSVPSVTKIHYRLMDDPDYQYTAREAGLTVSRAVESVCPKYKSALMAATREALSR